MHIRNVIKPLSRALSLLGGVLPDNVQSALLGGAIVVRHHQRPGSPKDGTYPLALLTRDGLERFIARTQEELVTRPTQEQGGYLRTVQELEWARDTLLPLVEPLPPLLAGVARSRVAVRKLLLQQDRRRPVYILIQMAERALQEHGRRLRPHRTTL